MRAAIVVLVLATQELAQQAPPSAPAGVIAGTLVTADRGEPVRKAQVRVMSASPRLTRATTTDADGRFVFEGLPAGEFTMSASKAGFIDTTYGARRFGPAAPGTPIRLGAGQKVENLSFRLPRGGVITGTVLDEFGDPAFTVSVRALRFAIVNGQRTIQPAGSVGTTDDRGMYRIAGLPPGEYLVSATPRDTVAQTAGAIDSLRRRQIEVIDAARAAGDATRVRELERMMSEMPSAPASTAGYVPVYHPGVAQPSASTRVTLGLSEEAGGIDMRLQVMDTAVVTGVVSADVPLPAEVNVMLLDPAMPVAQVGVWFRTAGRDGRFAFHGVVPGQYVLRARAGLPPTAPGGAGEITAAKDVVVTAGPASEHALRLERGVAVSGTLALDTITAPVDLSRVRVELYPITTAADWEMPIWRETPDEAGRFTARGVVPGRFRVNVTGLPPGWLVASAVFGGRDAADHHLIVEAGRPQEGGVIRFTDQPAEISGALTNAMGNPAPGYTVVAFPADTSLWLPMSRRIVVAQSGADGRYVLRNLPPGDYRLAAVLDPETGAWFDREFLAQILPAAASVTLAEGEKRTQALRVR